jgi:hypothetical protein
VTAAYPIASYFKGNVADVRVFSGSLIVPTGNFTTNTAPFSLTAPNYATNMGLVGTANTVLALQSQYFPGASTSPYGPCLTLPGTVGSYYSAANSAYDTNWRTSGFCLEMWINYASFANATNGGTAQSGSLTFSHGPGGGTYDWGFGAHNGGGLVLFNGGPSGANTANSVITTGSWNHIMVQGNGSNIYMAVNGVFQPLNAFGYSPAGGNNTIAPTQPSVLAITSLNPIYVGSSPTISCPNFAVAKARLVFGTSGSPSLGNVYSTGNFNTTLSPNFAPVPAGATVAWSLDSQYPLPSYPSIQDVTPLPSQLTSYGSIPTPVGGVTSNTLGPYPTTYPQLDSIRFDGTGYIDYGNAASSALTTNLWATPWTIEGWVYPTAQSIGNFIFARAASAAVFDMQLYMTNGNPSYLFLAYGNGNYSGGTNVAVSYNTWNHVAAVYNGTQVTLYTNGSTNYSFTPVAASLTFNPTHSVQLGYYSGTGYLYGNLADVRVSNVARYTGSSYTVPTEPFVTDSSTLLLLKSLAGQVGTTLEVQGRGLGSTSIGAGRTVQSYPPAPMSSYLLDTTSNSSVTYGQGKYVASASSEYSVYAAWGGFSKSITAWVSGSGNYSGTGAYTGSFTTVDALGNSYAGEWIQLQMPVSVILSTYQINPLGANIPNQVAGRWFVLGSRDGTNWTLVDQRSGYTAWVAQTFSTFTVSQTSAFNYYRLVINQLNGNSGLLNAGSIIFNGTEESLCITSDSKVGVGIANPQRALEVAGDLVVSGTISGGAGMGAFRNRIINGDMRIAQRGTSFTISGTNNDYYYLDRWTTYATGTFTFSQQTLTASDAPYQLGFTNSLRMTGTGTSTAYEIMQFFEGYNTVDLRWGTSFGTPVTVSLWLRSLCSAGSVIAVTIRTVTGSYSYNSPITITNPATWQYYTVTIPPPPNGASGIGTTNGGSIILDIGSYGASAAQAPTPNAWLASNYTTVAGTTNILATSGNYIELTGVQLEKGTVATPWEFRPYAQELALCQRYYYRIGGDATYQVFGLGSFIGSTTLAQVYIPFPVTMRVGATGANFSNSAVTTFWFGAGSGATCTAITQVGNAESRVGNQIQFTTSSAVTAGTGCIIEANNTTSAFLAFSAEL